jgi:predicted methyltransferase
MRLQTTLLASVFATVCATALAADAIPSYVNDAVHDPARPPLEVKRDVDRHPADVLAFAMVKPGQHVADLMPHAGYYTRMLSHLVGAKGHVYAFVPADGEGADGRFGPKQKDPSQNETLNRIQAAQALEDTPAYQGNTWVVWEPLGAFGGELGLPEQVDEVFSADGYHTLKGKEFAKLDMAGVDKAIFRALKAGGYYVVVDNAAKPGAGFTAADSLQRSDEAAVKAEVLAAGFVLDGESKAQANPSDDHSKVADLNDRNAVPDAFVLRFKKPLDAKTADKRPPKNAMDGYYGNTVRDNYDKAGAKSGDRERREFYHADGTYQEFGAVGSGNNPFQTGYYWWDVDGHNCMLHRFPSDQRDFTVCHGTSIDKKPGDKWVQDNGRGPQNYTMEKGYVYFEDAKDQ